MVGAGWLVQCEVEGLWHFQLGVETASGALQQQPSTTYEVINKTMDGLLPVVHSKRLSTRSRSWNRRPTGRIKRKSPALWRQWDQSPREVVQDLFLEVFKPWWDKALRKLVWAHGWACLELEVGLRLPAWVVQGACHSLLVPNLCLTSISPKNLQRKY